MKFRKINEKTINCIITQDDMKKHGINLDDLFDRKKNAVEFIKAIIAKAARSVNFNMKNEYTSMRLSVLPDHSVSLTISQDPFENEKIRRKPTSRAPLFHPGELTCSGSHPFVKWRRAAAYFRQRVGSKALCILTRIREPTI